MTRSLPSLIALVVGAVLALAPVAGAGVASQSGPGKTISGTVTSNGTEYPYRLYTPVAYQQGRPAPLVVVVHGCQTTAEQMEHTRFNDLAEREGFIVLYPEVDEAGRQLPGPLNHCWKFFDPTAYFRGNGDPAAIAEMTRQVMSDRAIDGERVYLVGVSAGGLMTSASAAAYPDLYTAVGIVASAGYADASCFTTGTGIPVEASASLAHLQMGPRARVVPAIAIGSDADLAFPASCTRKALEQSLRTNNLVLNDTQDAPLALTPAAVREGQEPNGRAYTVGTFVDPDGCLVGERWIIHGMPHAWPGGAQHGGYTDPRAPDGAEATWAFFERFRRSETSMPCAESSALAPPSPTASAHDPSTAAPEPATSASPSSSSPAASTGPPNRAGGTTLARTGRGDVLAAPALLLGAALALASFTRASRRPSACVPPAQRPSHRRR